MSVKIAVGLVSAFLIGWVVGCASHLAQPTPEDVQWAVTHWPDTTLQGLQQGRAIYVQKCAGCHNLHRPEEYPPEEWTGQIDEMAEDEDVVLNPSDRELITRYLITVSSRVRDALPSSP